MEEINGITVKFILVTYENNGITCLIRESDGMMVASCQANKAAYLADGDPNLQPETHLFLDNDFAIRYMKENIAPRVAAKEAHGRPVVCEFEQQNGDSRIVMPMAAGKPH